MIEEIKEITSRWKKIYEHNKLLRKLRWQRAIILVAGHHERSDTHPADTGARANGTTEHSEVAEIVMKAWQLLQDDGYKVIVVPFNLNLKEKVEWIKSNFPTDSLLVSVHMNAYKDYSTQGSEVWIQKGDYKLPFIAEKIARTISIDQNIQDRGFKFDHTHKYGRLGILRDTGITDSFLLELGFLSNKNDLKKMRENGAKAVRNACSTAWNYDHQNNNL